MDWTSVKWIKLRILMISGGFVLFLGLILFRSYQLQISDNARVHRLTQRQYQATLPQQPKRGAIYDRNGEALAIDLQVSSIGIHPQTIENKAQVAAQFAKILNTPVKAISEKLNSPKKFLWLARRVPAEAGEAITKLKIKGVSVSQEYRRFYPNKELAGNVLGAVGYDAKALGGIELGMDRYLKASSSKLVAQRDAKGRLYTPVGDAEANNDVYLTIDKNIQFIAEKYLWETGKAKNAKSGFAIVSNPKTGEVLAMANYPAFNPNVYWEYPLDSWKNHAVLDSFEPGSTFKAIVPAAGLRSGKIGINEQFDCEKGRYAIGKRVIHDHHPYGMMGLADIMRVSSNIGVTKVGMRVGKEIFYDMITSLGFGSKSGIDFPGEERGLVPALKRWGDIHFSNISFGQGLTVNGVQMAQAYGVFANGGTRMKPFLVSKVVDRQGEAVLEHRPTEMGQVVDSTVAKQVTRLLEGVVTPEGTGNLANVEGYVVAGKTGTAQKVNPKTKAYDPDHFVSSFIGYVPAKKPEFVIYVVYDAPRPIYMGGLVAAPVFSEIAREALAYRGVLPSSTQVAAKE